MTLRYLVPHMEPAFAMPAISPIRCVEDRTDKVTSCAVAFFSKTKNKRPELDLDVEAQAALDEARAMPQGPERAAAMQKTGIMRNAADSHGMVYAKVGETHENLVGVVDSVWSKEDDCRTLWYP